MTVTYSDRGTEYAAQKGVTLMHERSDYQPGAPETLYAKGPGRPDFFPCRVDSFGNVCDADGRVVFPSRSGAHPLEAGEPGYFGAFHENFYFPEESSDLPRVGSAISLRAARKASGLTQQQLSDASGVAVRQIQKMESGEIKLRNASAANVLALADALSVDPHDLL